MHVSLLIGPDVAFLIDHPLDQGIRRTGLTVTACLNLNQISSGAVGIQGEPTVTISGIPIDEGSNAPISKQKSSLAVARRIDLAPGLPIEQQSLSQTLLLH